MIGFVAKTALRNATRHRLRSALTVLGLVVAFLAFGLLRTVVNAWYAGADAASDARLVTRNAVSLVFPLPLSYRDRIRSVDGVESVAWGNWFGGVYIEESNFFPQFAIGGPYLDMYPEFQIPDDQRLAFERDQRGAIAGRKTAEKYGWQVGDVIPIKGTIFQGDWPFVLRGIYDGRDPGTDESQFFFHWKYLNESIKQRSPTRGDNVGFYVIEVSNPKRVAEISETIDERFQNSIAETLTETEKAFQLGFVAMTEAIVIAIEVVAYVVILIILAVLANTMAMSVRERTSEYATLKALGFSPLTVGSLIMLESIMLCAIGAGLAITLTYPAADGFARAVQDFLPVFQVAEETPYLQAGFAAIVAFIAAITPAIRAGNVTIVEGLRSVA
ncbi:ABC transporter permease [Permianibacter aggregans]|uniref:Putative ABC transport system permease protein n=1 Tax=Permianibacter aggregans TaxID=1510150 RepID=A0A4R6UMW0_9GAMM|nr:ABC transporter permease [Permianibacter aggregans]QGX40740.1 ABC transporter permease [Permianibacter aggregans]TDQ48448.1 putative ABC transport system permease protein [Permianibacter aggregans]